MNDPIGLGATPSPEILIEAARAVVRTDGAAVALTARERELAVVLAVADRALSARELGLLLNPDADDIDAANLAKVYVHRLRRRLGATVLLRRAGGYVLAPFVVRDVAEARRALTRLGAATAVVEPSERGRLRDLAASLRSEPPAFLAACEWFAAHASSLRRLGHELAVLLARSALARGEAADAACIARELTYEDGCDEEAWELLLTAYVQAGDAVSALQGLRFYEREVSRALNATPSAHVRAILERAAV
jgi:DNA-binding SARP family transcriptional activator